MTDTISPDVLLEDLGDTADEVALNLERLGITGIPQNQECCAIARYLTDQGFTSAVVIIDEWRDGLEVLASGWAGVPAPDAVAEFVAAFDQGKYPALIEAS